MIPDLESRAIQAAHDATGARRRNVRKALGDGDGWVVDIGQHEVEVVVRRISVQGNTESTIATLGTLFRQAPRFVFLCGIAGSLKPKSAGRGDVVIASDVEYRGFNKITAKAPGSAEIHFRPASYPTGARPGAAALVDRFLTGRGRNLAVVDGAPSCKAVYEKILAWDLVLDHAPTKEALLRDVEGNLAAVEMESGGFLKAIAYYRDQVLTRPGPRCGTGLVDGVVVRGLSDPAAGKEEADADPRDWRWIAARNAAEVTVRLIRSITPDDLMGDQD